MTESVPPVLAGHNHDRYGDSPRPRGACPAGCDVLATTARTEEGRHEALVIDRSGDEAYDAWLAARVWSEKKETT